MSEGRRSPPRGREVEDLAAASGIIALMVHYHFAIDFTCSGPCDGLPYRGLTLLYLS